MKLKNIYSYLTAIERDKLSFPMNWLKRRNLLIGDILDFGCGLGTDVEFLRNEDFSIVGYDNYYFKKYPNIKFDTVTCIYVLNVIDGIEQSKVLMSISELLKSGGKAYFVVRRDINREGFRMHYKHKKPTFQTNVKLPFKTIFENTFCEIYEYQHFNLSNNRPKDCIFCSPGEEIILETALAYSMFDMYPVSEGHSLIIPKRHVSNYFDLTLNEQIASQLIIYKLKIFLDKKYNPDGYNVGVNIGKTGGQTINHVHIHLIPRYENDVENPIGGVRNVIPNKGDYTTNSKNWKNQ